MEGDRKSAGAAFFFSIIPGAGHIYAGSPGKGIAFLAGTVFAYNASPGLGMIVHFICAASAARSAAEANRRERAELHGRRENASDVARILDEAVKRAPGAPAVPPPLPGSAGDPPPRLMRAAFPVAPEVLVEGLARGMQGAGLLVLGVDRKRLRVRASADLGGGLYTTAVGQVEGTPSGSRVRLLVDRPEGSPLSPDRDDAILREILERTEQSLSTAAAPSHDPEAPRAAPVIGEGEALTEDHFLDHLREAWESFEQGWLPEPEWRDRKRSLLTGMTLRPGTRFSDFMAVCRPLVEAGVLDPEDLRLLESRLR